MALSTAEIDSLFFESVPDEIQRALIQCVFGAYRTVFADCSKFQEEEAKDIRPFFRWVQIRSDLRGLPARFEGVSATPERYHTRVTCGKIIITPPPFKILQICHVEQHTGRNMPAISLIYSLSMLSVMGNIYMQFLLMAPTRLTTGNHNLSTSAFQTEATKAIFIGLICLKDTPHW